MTRHVVATTATSGGCTPSASAGLPGSAMASSPTAAGSVSSVDRVGIPMGSTELAVGGAGAESVGAADDADAPCCTSQLQPVHASFDVGQHGVDIGEHGLMLANRHRCPFDHRSDNAVRIAFIR
jgi:hypothetical protein